MQGELLVQITVPVPLVGAHLPTSLNLIFQWILLPEIVTKAPYLAYADDVIFVYIHWQEGTVTYLPRLDPYQLSNYRVVLAIKAGTMEAEGDGGGGVGEGGQGRARNSIPQLTDESQGTKSIQCSLFYSDI